MPTAARASPLLPDAATRVAMSRIVRLAAALLHAPIALLSRVTPDRILLLSHTGLPRDEASRGYLPPSHSFCPLVSMAGRPFALADTEAAERPDNVECERLGIRAYAGIPVRVDGHVISVLAAADRVPREWSDSELQLLQDLADTASERLAVQRLTSARDTASSLDFAPGDFVVVGGANPVGAGEGALDRAFDDAVDNALVGARHDAVVGVLGRALEDAPDAVFLLDPDDSTILAVNRAACALFGRARAELVGVELDAMIPVPSGDLALDPEARAGEPVFRSWPHTLPDGREVILEAAIAPCRRGGREIIIATVRDITRRARHERELHCMERLEAIGRLAGGIAHDFNSLLTAIQGHAQLSIDELDDASPAREHIEAVRSAAERAAKLTRQLLAFGRKQLMVPRDLDLKTIITELSPILTRLVGDDTEFVTSLAPGPCPVRADPDQLRQVIIDLVVNAREAMPEGGRITVATRTEIFDHDPERPYVRPGEYVVLTVVDTGPGLSPELRDKVFEPFVTTKARGGAGLGLATAYGIVKQSGGFIDIVTEPGRGCAFEVLLPRVAGTPAHHPAAPHVHEPKRSPSPGRLDEAAPALEAVGFGEAVGSGEAGGSTEATGTENAGGAEPDEAASPPGGEVILLVEDEEAVRALARRVLEKHGYRVLSASDGHQAIRIAREHTGPIHLLLTDVVMPSMGGGELSTHLTRLVPSLRVLYMSGFTEDETVREGVEQSMAAFLPKPFSPSTLVQTVRQVLDESGPTTETGSKPTS